MKIVKVARVGDRVKEVALNSNGTIKDAFDAAGLVQSEKEVIFVNHSLAKRDDSHLLAGDLIILEERKELALDPGMTSFINLLFDEEILEVEDYEDDTYNLNYHEAYRENKEMIDNLISKAKEV